VLDTILASPLRAALLTQFLTHPGEHYHIRGLARTLRVAKNARSVQRELERLEAAGVLLSERVANLRYFTVNTSSPVYPELQAIVWKTTALGDVLRTALADLDQVEWAFIYGSCATAQADANSDVDLMIIGQVDVERLASVVAACERRLSRPIHFVVFPREELLERLARAEPFVNNVMAGAKIVLLGDADDLQRIGAAAAHTALSSHAPGDTEPPALSR
jgi:predicted nucleotidyltransferase